MVKKLEVGIKSAVVELLCLTMIYGSNSVILKCDNIFNEFFQVAHIILKPLFLRRVCSVSTLFSYGADQCCEEVLRTPFCHGIDKPVKQIFMNYRKEEFPVDTPYA